MSEEYTQINPLYNNDYVTYEILDNVKNTPFLSKNNKYQNSSFHLHEF